MWSKPKRDGLDYDGVTGVTHMLNNTDSVLKKGEVEGAIQDYEALFAGARTEVCCRGGTANFFGVGANLAMPETAPMNHTADPPDQ